MLLCSGNRLPFRHYRSANTDRGRRYDDDKEFLTRLSFTPFYRKVDCSKVFDIITITPNSMIINGAYWVTTLISWYFFMVLFFRLMNISRIFKDLIDSKTFPIFTEFRSSREYCNKPKRLTFFRISSLPWMNEGMNGVHLDEIYKINKVYLY